MLGALLVIVPAIAPVPIVVVVMRLLPASSKISW